MTPNLITLVIVLVMGCTFSLIMAIRARRASTAFATAHIANNRVSHTSASRSDMDQSAIDRLLKPLLRRLYQFGKALTPKHTIAQIQHNLIMAGQPGDLSVTDFLGLRFLIGALFAGGGFVLAQGSYSPGVSVFLALTGFGMGIYMPLLWLKSKVQNRQKEIALDLPPALDMLSICVEAGLGFEAAMQKVATHDNGELALEFRRVVSEIRLGVRRVDALRHLAERTGVPEVGSFIAVLVQSDKLGVAIRDVLNAQADQMRMKRRQRAEEEARKAPLKMLFPLILFIFPALFIVLLGPAVPMILDLFGA